MKTIITQPIFNPGAQTLDFSTFPGFDIVNLYAVINTNDSTIIYATALTGKGYTSVVGDLVTLEFDTSSMSASDDLQVLYDDPNATVQIIGPLSVSSLPNLNITNFPTVQSVNVINSLSIASLPSITGSVAIVGNLSVSSLPNVVISNFPATQPVSLTGVVDSGNSTTTNLGVSSVFTGVWTDVLLYNNIVITILASSASATNGLQVQWSNDGSTIHSTDIFNISANLGKQFSFGRLSRYYRIVYTNGVIAQTSFSLQTILCIGNLKPSSHRINDSIIDEDDAELIKAVITGRTTGGIYKNVNVDADGNLQTIPVSGSSIIPTLGTNLVYDDMNVANNGIARGTSIVAGAGWTQVYSYTGSGILMGVLQTLETIEGTAASGWFVRLVIDSNELFTATGIATRDLATSTIYNFNIGTTPSPTWGGLNIVQDTFRWDSPNNLPVSFTTNVTVYVSRSGAVNKLWRAGVVCIAKV